MNCGCAAENCEHKKIQRKIYSFKGWFVGTQNDYHQQQEKIREANEWIEILDMLENEEKDKK
jgi:hypothetical protein